MTSPKTIKVLHIDDDAGFLEMFRKTCGGEFDIVSLSGGDDVPEIVSREMPDALVLDYELPGRNGLELLATIREKYPSLPVIFYTGQGNEEIARQAFREGATDYFVKRASDFAQKEKLVNSIRKALEKRSVEEELAEKQAMLEGIIEHNPYSIMIIDSKGRPVKTNRAHTKLMGISPGSDGTMIFDEALTIPDEVKEAVQREWAEKRDTYSVFTDENALRDEEAAKAAELWQSGEVFKCPPFRYSHPFPVTGSTMKPVWVGCTGFSIKSSDGQIVNYIHMHEDITARVEAEEALRNAHQDLTGAHEALRTAYESVEQKVTERTAELAEANTKLAEVNNRYADANNNLTDANNRLAEANTKLADANDRLTDTNTKLQAEIEERTRLQIELEKQNTELESFSHTVSHDLRNNLIVMQRLMERGNMAQDDRQKTQELLLNNTAHLQQFVERLLFLAQAGRTIAEKRKVSLDEAAWKAFSMAAASDGNAELSVISPFPPVLCDPVAFEQIFSNLFSNSLIYSNPDAKPVIKVGCAINNGTAEITVSDNGKGLDPAVLPKVFDSTFTTDRREHFGLGLAIVKKLVEAHGGTIRAESDGPGKGAAFVITLPHDSQQRDGAALFRQDRKIDSGSERVFPGY
ncbi:MAG: ATP-binding protein [Candidatus Xenobiia bacterium LiM19]